MKIRTEQKKPHMKHMSIAHVITVSLSFIKAHFTIVYIKEEFESIREEFKSTN